MTYYVLNSDNQIILVDEDLKRLQTTTKLPILQTKEDEVIYDGQLMTVEEAEALKEAEEQERIDNLTVTALDLITFLKNFGLTDEMVEEYLNSHLQAKHQLMFCQNVYCKVAKSFMPLVFGEIEITEKMIEEFFIYKNTEA